MKAVIYLIASLGLLCSTIVNATLLNLVPESVEAQAWTVIDTQSGQVIAEHNSHVQRAPASLTKMMVAYITLKELQAGHLRKDEVLTATPVVNMVMWDESQMYLKQGEQISVDQLLAGLVVMSANDAAVTLAERIAGDVPKFIARMNKEAQALGMKDTHFQNPAGISMPEHYSTAADLALLGQALVTQTPDYLNYSKQQSFSYNNRFHHATNRLLKLDPTVDGLKTGFTKAAGYNLALTANRPTMNPDTPERRLVVIVLGAASAAKRAEVAYNLMNMGYTYTRNEVAIKDKQLIAELPVIKSTLKMFKLETSKPQIITTSLYDQPFAIDLKTYDTTNQRIMLNTGNGTIQTIEPLQETKTHLNVEINEKLLTAPLAKVMQLATVQVYQNNQLIRTITIEDDVQIEEANFFQKIAIWFKQLFSLFSSNEVELKIYPLGQ
ncbi:MAG: D-alanyl-D-alanine carboxypeptidase PBP6B [Acinetobacter sp.]|uniref:D-alanyl-D-alanine carboxypeptidase (Penicillin-binding protein 5/6) n=1 Tax=Acinetobacter bohemicus TaxID=1435036 RepID=A0A1I6NRT2_9GAMM|nr:D-alanyl-D-alanine carboxypeptidase PBP6B [Acinetobacter bohemicus]KAB0655021.1 D-alanyl-D-alanine carboxypeptidase PBP6B [Acinetobacter bohemicus]MBP8027697.1 D-alanyl-D-alanine carboxypeptidase PBP6B [Acinetobacter sp.]SFS30722.1 D-alanyl-D-alanine carboxypeptidase (penicillin-binding protein 5/6) [Acinetobacter bohemicus]